MKTVEYRVRPVTRFVITRFESGEVEGGGTYGGCEVFGEFDHKPTAERVLEILKANEANEASSDP